MKGYRKAPAPMCLPAASSKNQALKLMVIADCAHRPLLCVSLESGRSSWLVGPIQWHVKLLYFIVQLQENSICLAKDKLGFSARISSISSVAMGKLCKRLPQQDKICPGSVSARIKCMCLIYKFADGISKGIVLNSYIIFSFPSRILLLKMGAYVFLSV